MAFNIGDFLVGFGQASNPFGLPSVGKWNLTEGTFIVGTESVKFFFETPNVEEAKKGKTAVDQIADSGGRRIARYEYPYRDGQRLKDLGRKGETFTFNIKFFGDQYQQRFQEFLKIVNTDQAGQLIHPVRSSMLAPPAGQQGPSSPQGTITCRFESYEFMHRHDEWNAVTIKAVFVEDQTDQLLALSKQPISVDSELRDSLQRVIDRQKLITDSLFQVGAVLRLPAAFINAANQRVASISAQIYSILGALGATYAPRSATTNVVAQAINIGISVANLNSGSVQDGNGSTELSRLPPVFQVGFDPASIDTIQANIQAFIAANQIPPQQAVFVANQIRQSITAAINDIEANYGNDGSDMIVAYREMANAVQSAVEASVAAQQTQVRLLITDRFHSIRSLAFSIGFSPDRGNEIELLNPFLASVNYIPRGTSVIVPAS